jgi:hypothetical protein
MRNCSRVIAGHQIHALINNRLKPEMKKKAISLAGGLQPFGAQLANIDFKAQCDRQAESVFSQANRNASGAESLRE